VSPPESSANLTAQGQKSDCPVALRREDFRRILREPEYLLVKQYIDLLGTEGLPMTRRGRSGRPRRQHQCQSGKYRHPMPFHRA
jgi:hypothetical protein